MYQKQIVSVNVKLLNMRSLKLYAFIFLSLSCVCAMCSKEDATDNSSTGNNNGTPDPVLSPDSTWVYFEDCPSLAQTYPNNNRPFFKKWFATKIGTGVSGTSGQGAYLVWGFENTGDSRFLQNAGNPGGKEAFSISLKNFSKTPGAGSYQMDIDYKEGYCWYYVYNSSGRNLDSVRTQGISKSSFNVTSMSFYKSIVPTVDRYKMSGNGTFNIMYWQNGTSSTTNVHTLQCKFNNVFVDVLK